MLEAEMISQLETSVDFILLSLKSHFYFSLTIYYGNSYSHIGGVYPWTLFFQKMLLLKKALLHLYIHIHTQRKLFTYYRIVSYSKPKFLTFPLFNFKLEKEIWFLNLLHLYPAIIIIFVLKKHSFFWKKNYLFVYATSLFQHTGSFSDGTWGI